MTISLNGVTLDQDLFWDEEFNYSASAQSILRTILGNIVVQNVPFSTGEEIYLLARREGSTYTGYFTRSQIEDFKTLEQNATTVTFIYGSETHSVIVKSGGVQMNPLIPYTTKTSTDKYTGTLTLIKV